MHSPLLIHSRFTTVEDFARINRNIACISSLARGRNTCGSADPREASESADIGASLNRYDLLAERKMLFMIVGVIVAALCMDLQWVQGLPFKKRVLVTS